MARVAPHPAWLSRGRVPGLDGLRAVSILLVLFTHAGTSPGFPGARALYSGSAEIRITREIKETDDHRLQGSELRVLQKLD